MTVLGYLTQCGICPQQAVLDEQMTGWVCPRCADVAEPVITARRWLPGDPHRIPDGPPMQIGVDFRLGDRYPPPGQYAAVTAAIAAHYAGFGDIDVAAAEPIAPDDEYPIGKVQG